MNLSSKTENWHNYQLAGIDRTLIRAFPIVFLIFNIVYWPICLN